MFEVPSAKRIKRSEAFDSDEATTPSAVGYKAVGPNYGFDYDFITPVNLPSAPAQQDATKDDASKEEESFTFRLFTSTAPSTLHIQPDEPEVDAPLSEGRFLRASRPDSYYFTSALDQSFMQKHRHQIALSATSHDELLKRANCSWPGTQLPWRVTHLPSATTATIAKSAGPTRSFTVLSTDRPARSPKRSKPNKKRRIILRQRLTARRLNMQSTEEREKAEREKRNVRNREKKIKRRERDRKKKADAKLAEGATDS